MVTKGLNPVFNGSSVIAYTNKEALGKKIKSMQDLPSLYSWYTEDPLARHLGLMKFWDFKTTRPKGLFDEMLTTNNVLETTGWDGKVTYDLPVETNSEIITTKDMSHQSLAGIDGGTFKIVLNRELQPGHVITYDVFDGLQVVVVEGTIDEAVKPVSEGFEHTVMLATNNNSHSFLTSFLKKGVQYYIVNGTVDGERGTKFVGFEYGNEAETMRCEFQLGSMTAVESYMTGMAASKMFSGADAKSREFVDLVSSEFYNNDIVVVQDAYKNAEGKVVRTGKPSLGATLEMLTMRELQRLTNQKLMWQSAATIRNTNGVLRLNEGLYKQMKRGAIFKYGRKGGITVSLLMDLVNYIYRNNPYMAEEDRNIELRCGKYAYRNVLDLFDAEVRAQLGALATAGLMGQDRVIPNPVKGNDLRNLEMNLVRFTKVYVRGLGNLKITHDASLDHAGAGQDRRINEGNPENLAPTTYSIIVSDVSDKSVSNNRELPKGTKLVDGGSDKQNVYLVKPEGAMTYWGSSNGRYDYRRSGDIVSSMKQIGQEFWAFNIVDILLLDPSRVAMIELDRTVSNPYL